MLDQIILTTSCTMEGYRIACYRGPEAVYVDYFSSRQQGKSPEHRCQAGAFPGFL